MNIVLLGAPGSGKGTQAKPLSVRYGVPHISTGDIFRQEMAKSSDLGLKVQQYVSSGRLVPDELVLEIVTARLAAADCAPGFILDGFPRTVSQAEGLDAFLNGAHRTLDKVLYMDLSEKEVVQRLSSRRSCPKCGKVYNLLTQAPRQADVCDVDGEKIIQREDDRPDTVEKRLVVYNNLTEPLISYYRGLGVLEKISAAQSVADVQRAIFNVLDALPKA
ncbi:MAG TPA: adenylate kinase [Elusimicrobiota bacterium]|nr:adenylate kinase [Elusimicrobiota bacterium]